MIHIRPIESDPVANKVARDPGDSARTFVRLRAESLIEAGATRRVLELNGLNNENIVTAWAQRHAQDEQSALLTERFVGAFDETGVMLGAIEAGPVTDEYLKPYESPLDLLMRRRALKPDADAIAVFALMAQRGEGHLDVLVELLRHTVNKNAIGPKTIYFGAPTESSAHHAALEEQFEPQGKYAKRFGVEHTLLARNVGMGSFEDYSDEHDE